MERTRTNWTKLLAFVGALAALALLVAGPQYGSAQTPNSWPTFHGDMTRSGISSVSGPTTGNLKRQFTLPQGVTVTTSVVVDANDVGYVGASDGAVYALDPTQQSSTNHPDYKWRQAVRAAGAGGISGTPTLSGDGKTLYLGTEDGYAYALNTADGKSVWQDPTYLGPITTSPLVSNDGGTVYVASQGGLTALSTKDGSIQWHVNTPAISQSPTLSPEGGTVYAVTGPYMYGIPANGKGTATTYYLDSPDCSGGNGTTSPAVDPNGNVYVGTDKGTMFKFSSTSGNAVWCYTVDSKMALSSSPTFLDNQVIFGAIAPNNQGGYLYALASDNKNLTWRETTAGPIVSSPAAATGNNLIYLGDETGKVYAFDLKGKVQFSPRFGGGLTSSPALSSAGTLWFAAGDSVYELGDPATPTPTATATATSTVTPTRTPIPSITPTLTPSSTATPTPNVNVPSPEPTSTQTPSSTSGIAIDSVKVLHRVSGHNREAKSVHLGESVNFVMLYRPRGSGALPKGKLVITRKGKTIRSITMHVDVTEDADGTTATYHRGTTFRKRSETGTLYAHFHLTRGSTSVKRDRRFSVAP